LKDLSVVPAKVLAVRMKLVVDRQLHRLAIDLL
jgi:hypothetical protein